MVRPSHHQNFVVTTSIRGLNRSPQQKSEQPAGKGHSGDAEHGKSDRADDDAAGISGHTHRHVGDALSLCPMVRQHGGRQQRGTRDRRHAPAEAEQHKGDRDQKVRVAGGSREASRDGERGGRSVCHPKVADAVGNGTYHGSQRVHARRVQGDDDADDLE